MIPAYQEKCKYLSPKDGEKMSKKRNAEELTYEELELAEIKDIIEIESNVEAEAETIIETDINIAISDAIQQIEETYSIPKTSENTRKTEMCRILYVKPNVLAFDFKGYGIHISTDHILDQDIIPKKFIEVEYESDIGKPDFKYFVKFQ